jgi:hypothetical protein
MKTDDPQMELNREAHPVSISNDPVWMFGCGWKWCRSKYLLAIGRHTNEE